ncbi:MAG: M1 family metallopeptidase [Gemmatimonadaceae bacterium]
MGRLFGIVLRNFGDPSFLFDPAVTMSIMNIRFTNRSLLRATIGAYALCTATLVGAQTAAPKLPERAVRRDIPITNAIKKAYLAGSRDSSGAPNSKYWQLRTDYNIDAKLDVQTSRLTGHEIITITNNSPDALTQIGMRLDQNHFLANVPRAAPWIPSETTDGFAITKITVDGKPVSLTPPPGAGGRGGRGTPPPPPTDNYLRNGKITNTSIALVNPIPSKGTAKVEIEWNHKIPGATGNFSHRMSQRWGDTLYQPTQWYPRVSAFDDMRGWDAELYLGPSEFYNNFGTFDVSIDAPAGWIVGGTGVLQNPQEVLTTKARAQLAKVLSTDSITTIVGADEIGAGQATANGNASGRLVWRFHADTVNDFAWVTAKKLVWNATRATIPTRSIVPVNMYFQPGNAAAFANAGRIAAHALEFYSKLWFPYQFPQLTLQDGPSAGMEYPMVINSNQGAADHETGHQWWPMVVSNNETMYGWMDEGFNQYMNILSAADVAKTAPNLDERGSSYGSTSGNEGEPPMMWNANYAGPAFYSFETYQKTPLMLSMLGGIVGDSAVQRAQSEWGKAWMFKHPSPWDYMFFMNKALKKDLGWFWYYWLFTTESVDGSVSKVTTTAAKTSVVVKQAGQMPAPVVLQVKFAEKGAPIKAMKNSVMKDSVTAVVTYPVDVWFAGSRTFTAELTFGARKIESIQLDPGCRFPDHDASDNVWPRVAAEPNAPVVTCSIPRTAAGTGAARRR